jgi:hypothetical protein
MISALGTGASAFLLFFLLLLSLLSLESIRPSSSIILRTCSHIWHEVILVEFGRLSHQCLVHLPYYRPSWRSAVGHYAFYFSVRAAGLWRRRIRPLRSTNDRDRGCGASGSGGLEFRHSKL